jgi:hypothetical protein
MSRGWLLLLLAAGSCRTAAPDEPWRELFDGRSLGEFVVTDFGGQGEIAVRQGLLRLGFGSPLTGVTWTGALPGAEYELEVTAAREQGHDFFCGVTFPVGDQHLTLVLGGWGGAVCGLSSLDGLDAAHNETRTARSFETGRDYTVRIVVTARRVEATVDGEPLAAVDWTERACSVRPEVLLSRPLGIACYATEATVRSCRWRPRR